MGSVKLKDLKAYVRYDGSGRVVSGSLVFRKKKPKNGRWGEITKNLCCNENPSSTTTTTTQGGGTPTAWVTYVAGNQENACAQTSGWSFVLYTAGSTLGAGVVLYTDATLTTEFNSYQYASILYNNGTLYQLSDLPGDGTIVNVIGACPSTTTTTTSSAITVGLTPSSCGTPAMFVPVSFTLGNSICDQDVVIAGDFGMLPQEFYVIYNGYSRYFFKLNDSLAQGAGGAPGECILCPTTTTTTTSGTLSLVATSYFNTGDACAGTNPTAVTTVYPSNLNFNSGTTFWLNPELTQTWNPGMAGWTTFAGYPGITYYIELGMGDTRIVNTFPCG